SLPHPPTHFFLGSIKCKQYEVVGAADPVFAVVGEDVVLPCLVKPNISVVDMRVEWFRFDLKDSVVHLYEDHVDKNADQRNTSLKLSSVKVSDEGIYKCCLHHLTSWLIVGRLPVITVDGFDDSGGLHLQCESEGWNPEPVLEWLNSEGVSLSSETTDTHRNTDGFSVKHTITLHHSDKIHCRVRLRHHMLEAVIISSSNFCHENKFLVCVNIPGNKAHSDSDSDYCVCMFYTTISLFTLLIILSQTEINV
uniref:Zgc:123297 n=1 Tax=Sinocyclocheilus grahami TaxID=75366 RepID=A0A672LV80_SINGR